MASKAFLVDGYARVAVDLHRPACALVGGSCFFMTPPVGLRKKPEKRRNFPRHRILHSTASWLITTLLGLARAARLQAGSDPVANIFTQLIQEAGRVLAVLLVKRCEGE